MMKQIDVGTCVPGNHALEWIPHIIDAGFECISLNFHMTTDGIEITELAPKVMALLEGTGVYVASIGFYCNALQNPDHKKMLEHFIDSAHLFNTDLVTTFAGGLEGRPVEDSIPKFREVFGDLTRRAEEKGVRIAIENCPMDGNWKNVTCNIGFNPKAWEMMFEAVPSKALGLEWEPAHQMVQLIDPLPQLKKWAHRIYHVHGKDATIDMEEVRRLGVFGAVEFALPRTPGFGDTNWRDVFTILHMNGYEGNICVEGYHDPVYQGDWEMTAQLHALKYLKWCRGGDFIPNPWDK